MNVLTTIKKLFRSLRNREEKETSENSKNFGSRNKIDSSLNRKHHDWEVNFLRTEFEKGSREKEFRKDIEEVAKKAGVDTIQKFWDFIFTAAREGCPHTMFGAAGECMDTGGEGLAYDLTAIEEAFELTRPTCGTICNLGCCARCNRLAYDIYKALIDRQLDDNVD